MIWNETKECISRDELAELQSKRLVKVVNRVYHNVEYYRKKMQEVGIEPGDIRGIEDITKLPYTTKNDLRDTYPFGLFAAPQSDIVRVHASSGTTGKATVVGYTRRDIDIWSECVSRSIRCLWPPEIRIPLSPIPVSSPSGRLLTNSSSWASLSAAQTLSSSISSSA